jgi:hypothetical protein
MNRNLFYKKKKIKKFGSFFDVHVIAQLTRKTCLGHHNSFTKDPEKE